MVLSQIDMDIIRDTHGFKCDCNVCRDGVYPTMDLTEDDLMEENAAYEKDYAKAKDILTNCWNDVNSTERANSFLYKSLYCAVNILEALAFQCSFPFPTL